MATDYTIPKDEYRALLDENAKLRELVRCRDCSHWVEDPDPTDPGWPMMCGDTGRDMVGPDGFCAWGERRAGL